MQEGMTCYSCQWSIGSCDGTGNAKLVCKLRLTCPVQADTCARFVYEAGTDEEVRDEN